MVMRNQGVLRTALITRSGRTFPLLFDFGLEKTCPRTERRNLILAIVTIKCLPAMQETRVQSLRQEDPLEKEMATHSSILAWRIPWTEETGGLQSTGSQRVGHD